MNSPQPPTPAVQSQDAIKGSMAITDFTIRIPGTNRSIDTASEPGQSRWRTKEFRFYYLIFALVVPMMVRIPARLSSSKAPETKNWMWVWRGC